MTKLRILLYANCDGSSAGGVQSVVRDLGRFLAGRGHAVSTGWAERSSPVQDSATGWAEQFPVRPDARRWFHLPSGARLIRRLLRERPQIVHIHYASPSARYFTALARWLPFRVMITCHGSDVLRPLAEDASHLGAVLEGADCVTTVTPDIRSRLAGQRLLAADDCLLVPNGVDTEFWHPAPEPLAAHTEPVLLAVGRLEPVKGIDLLIAACAELANAGRPVRLVIVGDGTQRAALGQQAQAAGIAERVIFTGALPPTAIRAQLHAADLYVLPSRSEGMPLALLEAMATATACIATSVGGVPKMAEGAVRLVRPEDPKDLAAAIAELAAKPTLRRARGQAARARAFEFSVARTNAAYEQAMLALAHGQRRGRSPALGQQAPAGS